MQSLFEDSRGRIWVFTKGGLAYFDGSRFVAVPGVPSQEVFSITGDEAGNLWLSGNRCRNDRDQKSEQDCDMSRHDTPQQQ